MGATWLAAIMGAARQYQDRRASWDAPPSIVTPEVLRGLNAMLTLNEIEKAVDGLTVDEKRELHRYLEETLHVSAVTRGPGRSHSILDIAPVQLGSVLQSETDDEDILDEMLEERQ